jgi:hypothetical protein
MHACATCPAMHVPASPLVVVPCMHSLLSIVAVAAVVPRSLPSLHAFHASSHGVRPKAYTFYKGLPVHMAAGNRCAKAGRYTMVITDNKS